MSRITKSADAFQPDMRSSWQRDRASAPMQADVERTPVGLLLVALVGALIGFLAVLAL